MSSFKLCVLLILVLVCNCEAMMTRSRRIVKKTEQLSEKVRIPKAKLSGNSRKYYTYRFAPNNIDKDSDKDSIPIIIELDYDMEQERNFITLPVPAIDISKISVNCNVCKCELKNGIFRGKSGTNKDGIYHSNLIIDKKCKNSQDISISFTVSTSGDYVTVNHIKEEEDKDPVKKVIEIDTTIVQKYGKLENIPTFSNPEQHEQGLRFNFKFGGKLSDPISHSAITVYTLITNVAMTLVNGVDDYKEMLQHVEVLVIKEDLAYTQYGIIHLGKSQSIQPIFIMHEYGHKVMESVYSSAKLKDESNGGDPKHRACAASVQKEAFALSEGYAEAFAIIMGIELKILEVNADGKYKTASWENGASRFLSTPEATKQLEYYSCSQKDKDGKPVISTPYTDEGRVTSMLYDLYDKNNDGLTISSKEIGLIKALNLDLKDGHFGNKDGIDENQLYSLPLNIILIELLKKSEVSTLDGYIGALKKIPLSDTFTLDHRYHACNVVKYNYGTINEDCELWKNA